ncbi:MAG: glycosyltransferase [Hyphomonadaceae bacterium]|nr:glycosyltransferase [Clostridia bacterium]
MATPFLSIIVPIYNVENYLMQCIDSILAQTFKDFEVVLVDDGSPDSCPSICDAYQKKDARVKVIHKENGGLVSARKAGVAIALGEYIGFVDSDDWIEPDMYEKMCNACTQYNVDVVLCDIVSNYEHKEIQDSKSYRAGFYNKQALIKEVYPTMLYNGFLGGRGIEPSLANKIFVSNLLKNNIFNVDERIKIGEDMACTYPCLLDAQSIFILDNQFLYHYRRTPCSLTASYKDDYFCKSLILYNLLQKVSREKHVYDIEHQLHANLLFFALTSIENEFVKSAQKSLKEKMQLVTEIAYHRDVICATNEVRSNMFSLKYKMYNWLLKKQSCKTLFVLVLCVRIIRDRKVMRSIIN